MPTKINTEIRNGEMLAASQEMIQQRLEAFTDAQTRLRELHVSIDIGNPDKAEVEITTPLGSHKFVSQGSAKSAVEAVDDAIKNLDRQLAQHLQERKSQAEQEQPEDRDNSFKQIGGTLAAILVLGLVGFAILRISGCQSDPFRTAHVSGVVTCGGQPVADATVFFSPLPGKGRASDTPGKTAYGETDESGNYRLSTYGNGDGAIIGDHIVGVSINRDPVTGEPRPYSCPGIDKQVQVTVSNGTNEINIDL